MPEAGRRAEQSAAVVMDRRLAHRTKETNVIIIPALLLLGRRARRTWQWNELARERFSARRRLGYGTTYALIHLKREWIWRPTRPKPVAHVETMPALELDGRSS